jgi:APA family basic amino acid/polyamine antiporter
MTTLARTLRTRDFFTLAFGTMVGVGWLVVIDDWLTRGGPAGAMLGFLLGGLALVPVAFVYGKFVRELRDASSEVAYASSVFPEWVAFLAGWLMLLAYLIVCPWEAVAVGKVAAYLFPALRSHPLYVIRGFPVFLPTLSLGIALTGFIVFLNYRGIRISARFQNYTTTVLLVLFALFSLVGFTRVRPENLRPLFARSEAPLGGLVSVVLVLQIVPYFLTGFETVPKCCEEAREGYDERGFSTAIYWALAVGVLFYLVILAVVSGLVPWQNLAHEHYATAVAFERAFGSAWIARVIVIAALFSLVKVFNANFIAASRLVFGLGRRRLILPATAKIHVERQTPVAAIAFCGGLTLLLALLGDSILIPVTEVGSMCSAFGWLLTCLAYVAWRARPTTPKAGRRRELAIAGLGALVALAFLMIKLVPTVPGSFGRWEYAALAIWLTLGLGLRARARA